MKTISILLISLTSLLSSTFAQSFTYQGLLRDGGSPANSTYDFRFRLWNAESDGEQVGTDRFADDLSVAGGLFTTAIDFGSVWDGTDRYLEIAVRPGNSEDEYQEFSPRVRVHYAPYSIFASKVPWDGITGMPDGFSDGIDNDTTYDAGAGLHLDGSTFSIDITGATAGQALIFDGANLVWGNPTAVLTLPFEGSANTASQHAALKITNTATEGETYSIWGLNTSPDGVALFGHATSTTGTNYGVMGRTSSRAGTGVFGLASSGNGVSTGVMGQSNSIAGTGVTGMAPTYGVTGYSTATSGFAAGVWGQSESNNGRGVYGFATAPTGATFGVWGLSASTTGTGVFGYAAAITGTNYGTYGRTDSSGGTGAVGLASSLTGTTYGLAGQSNSTSGTGVYGRAVAGSGTTYGVYGQSDSPSGYGGYFVGRGYFSSRVGIGVSDPEYRLELPNIADPSGQGRANAWVIYSSIRWKENVQPIDNALDKVLSLQGVLYDWKPEHGGKRDIGFIAEEVARILPEIVQMDADGIHALGLDYSRLVPVLVEAIKQLKAENDATRAQNAVLLKRLEAIEAKLGMK
jgi:hypothetical protein